MRFVHVNLTARDEERLADFYVRVFGCTLLPPRRDLCGPWLDQGTGLSGAHLHGMHLRLPGCGEHGPTLEIFRYEEMVDGPEPVANRPGFGHIAFAVSDVSATRDAVIAAGGRALGEVASSEIPDAGRLTFVYVRDPEGNLIELQSWGRREHLPGQFLQELADLEASYLRETDPIRQSGFGGGAERWRAERSPLLHACDRDGDFLDAACANGYLLECLLAWGRERGISLVPFGLDQGPRLITLAKARLSKWAANFFVGNAWDWEPPRRFPYVFSLVDCVPDPYVARFIDRLLEDIVAPGGRLIMGGYGSRSRGLAPPDVAGIIRGAGFDVAGYAAGGDPPITAFAWTDRT